MFRFCSSKVAQHVSVGTVASSVAWRSNLYARARRTAPFECAVPAHARDSVDANDCVVRNDSPPRPARNPKADTLTCGK